MVVAVATAIGLEMIVKEAMRPFAEVFPAANIHHHFVGQDQARGVYAKELHIPAGWTLGEHRHDYDHLSILSSGTVRLTRGGATEEFTGSCAITIKAGVTHTLVALTDAVWYCIHPTDCTDPDQVDDVLLRNRV